MTDPGANGKKSPNAPVQKMQAMELAWGFGKATGVDLPAESTGTIPTRQWLYYLWKDNAYTGQDWCKNGKAVRHLRAADRVAGLPGAGGSGNRARRPSPPSARGT